eukprot:7372677-Prorocentrum_lima.AAC.1
MVEVQYEPNSTLHTKDSYIVVPPESAIVTALWILGEQGADIPFGLSGYTVPWEKRQELVPMELARARGEQLQRIFRIQCGTLRQMAELGYTVDTSTDVWNAGPYGILPRAPVVADVAMPDPVGD